MRNLHWGVLVDQGPWRKREDEEMFSVRSRYFTEMVQLLSFDILIHDINIKSKYRRISFFYNGKRIMLHVNSDRTYFASDQFRKEFHRILTSSTTSECSEATSRDNERCAHVDILLCFNADVKQLNSGSREETLSHGVKRILLLIFLESVLLCVNRRMQVCSVLSFENSSSGFMRYPLFAFFFAIH